jgi:hypothetical protein
VVGVGEARITASGDARFAEARLEWRRLLNERWPIPAPRPRYAAVLAGFAFSPPRPRVSALTASSRCRDCSAGWTATPTTAADRDRRHQRREGDSA